MGMTRKQAIELLKKHHMWTGEPQEVVDVKLENAALDYAISSLKTDECYQIMYEGGEIFTKDDIVTILVEIQSKIKELPIHTVSYQESIIHMEIAPSAKDVYELIQHKINELKAESEEEDEKRPALRNKILFKIRKQLLEEKELAYADFDAYKADVLGVEADELPDDDFKSGLERAIDVINRS